MKWDFRQKDMDVYGGNKWVVGGVVIVIEVSIEGKKWIYSLG